MTTASFTGSALPSSTARNQWLLIGGLFLLMLIVSALLQPSAPARPYDLDSAEPNGLLALSLWLQDLGYSVDELDSSTFETATPNDPPADLLFVYPNAQPYTESEVATLATWVERGSTLVLIGPSNRDAALIEQFGVAPVQATGITFSQERAILPLLPKPEDGWSPGLSRAELDLSEAPNAVPVLANTSEGLALLSDNDQRATVAAQPLGQGYVWHLSTEHAFTNQALDMAEDGYILPALLRHVPADGTVLFDTYHLYDSATQAADGAPTSLRDWLYQTNVGRALLFGTLLLFGYLLLQGIRLGPPLPLKEEMSRREAAEYVVAMAGLQRRLGEPSHVAEALRHRLKLTLGKPLAIPATLPDQEFIDQWRERTPTLDPETIRQVTEILNTLSQNPNEQTLVDVAASIDKQVGK